MVEVVDLLPQVVVPQQHRTPGAHLQRVVGVRQARALGRRQVLALLRLAGRVVGGTRPRGRQHRRTLLVGLGLERRTRRRGLLQRRRLRGRSARYRCGAGFIEGGALGCRLLGHGQTFCRGFTSNLRPGAGAIVCRAADCLPRGGQTLRHDYPSAGLLEDRHQRPPWTTGLRRIQGRAPFPARPPPEPSGCRGGTEPVRKWWSPCAHERARGERPRRARCRAVLDDGGRSSSGPASCPDGTPAHPLGRLIGP